MRTVGPRLQGIALVTGAGGTIGSSIARKLAEAGMTVGAADIGYEQARATANSFGGRALGGDVTDPATVAGWVAELGGQVDLLVNNAAIDGAVQTKDEDPAIWWRTLEVNVRGPYLCVQAVLPGMREKGAGRIINIGSGGAFYTNVTFASMAYCASKAALCRYSEMLAERVAAIGIKVFTVSPGLVQTGLTRGQGDYTNRIWTEPGVVAAVIERVANGDLDALAGRYIHATDDIDALIKDTDIILAEDLRAIRLRGGPVMSPRAW